MSLFQVIVVALNQLLKRFDFSNCLKTERGQKPGLRETTEGFGHVKMHGARAA